MSTGNQASTAEAEFERGFDQAAPSAPQQPEAVEATPAEQPAPPPAQAEAANEAAANAEQPAQDDELASLPPKVREMLSELQSLKQAAAHITQLEQRLRKTEGRVGDLNARVPVPAPPPPPRNEKLEAVRENFPEIAELIEEVAVPKADKAQAVEPEDAPTDALEDVFPDWREQVRSNEFKAWLEKQADKDAIASTADQRFMTKVLSRYGTARAVSEALARQDAAKAEAAARANQTRQARTQAAVVPGGAARRAPVELTPEAAFEAGFNGR